MKIEQSSGIESTLSRQKRRRPPASPQMEDSDEDLPMLPPPQSKADSDDDLILPPPRRKKKARDEDDEKQPPKRKRKKARGGADPPATQLRLLKIEPDDMHHPVSGVTRSQGMVPVHSTDLDPFRGFPGLARPHRLQRLRYLLTDQVRRREKRTRRTWPRALLTTPLVRGNAKQSYNVMPLDPFPCLNTGLNLAAVYLHGKRSKEKLHQLYTKADCLVNTALKKIKNKYHKISPHLQRLQDSWYCEKALWLASQGKLSEAMDHQYRKLQKSKEFTIDNSSFYIKSLFHNTFVIALGWAFITDHLKKKAPGGEPYMTHAIQSAYSKMGACIDRVLAVKHADLEIVPSLFMEMYKYSEDHQERYYDAAYKVIELFLYDNPAHPRAWQFALDFVKVESPLPTSETVRMASNLAKCDPSSDIALNELRKAEKVASKSLDATARKAAVLVDRIENEPDAPPELWTELRGALESGKLRSKLATIAAGKARSTHGLSRLAGTVAKTGWWEQYYFAEVILNGCEPAMRDARRAVQKLFFGGDPTLVDLCARAQEAEVQFESDDEDADEPIFDPEIVNPEPVPSWADSSHKLHPPTSRNLKVTHLPKLKNILEIQTLKELEEISHYRLSKFISIHQIPRGKYSTASQKSKRENLVKDVWAWLKIYHKAIDPSFKAKKPKKSGEGAEEGKERAEQAATAKIKEESSEEFFL